MWSGDVLALLLGWGGVRLWRAGRAGLAVIGVVSEGRVAFSWGESWKYEVTIVFELARIWLLAGLVALGVRESLVPPRWAVL